MAYFGQTPAQKLADADVYFAEGNHIKALDWLKFDDNDRTAGLVQAERQIDANLGSSLEFNYSGEEFPLVEFSNFRPDWAIMEQAMFILENVVRQKNTATGSGLIFNEDQEQADRTHGTLICSEASLYLQLNRISIERG